jgi:hypothetical protein
MNNKTNTVKQRHSIVMSPQTWKTLEKIAEIKRKSLSQLLEEAVISMIKTEKINSAYFKIMSTVPYCDDDENEELTKMLDSLTEQDLTTVKKYVLPSRNK